MSLMSMGLRRESARLQLGDQRLHDFRGDRPALDTARPADVDADHAPLQINERAAAIARLQHRIMLQDDGIAAAAIAQFAAQTILELGAKIARLHSTQKRRPEFLLHFAALEADRDHVARSVLAKDPLKLIRISDF